VALPHQHAFTEDTPIKNLKISISLYFGFAVLILGVLFVALFGLYQVRVANLAMKSMYDDRVVALEQLKIASDMLTSNREPAAAGGDSDWEIF
jgi:hypothetical protein